ncbi:MAG: hypothetical protein NTZ21_02200 [Actinobacteria bacterium]|nr:hypothetical protein [Actinomycetota bacterium]
MIEFLPPRDHAFGEADAADFVGLDDTDDTAFDDEPPRSRWLTVLAVVGVTGLLAGGVLAAAPWESDETAAVPPATTVDRELDPTADAPTTVDDRTIPDLATGTPGWLPRSPSRFELVRAVSNGEVVPGGEALFMWTSVNATRTSGRWVVVDQRGASAYRDLVRNATVIDVGGRPGLLAESDDGVAELRVHPPAGDDYAVIAFGLGLDELVAVAASVERTVGGIAVPDEWTQPDGAPVDGVSFVLDGQVDWAPGSIRSHPPDTWAMFIDPATSESIIVARSGLTIDTILVDEYLLRVPIEVDTLDRPTRALLAEMSSQGRTVDLFTSAHDAGIVGARWFDGTGLEVVAEGALGTAELVRFTADLGQASTGDWADAIAGEFAPAWLDPTTLGGAIDGSWSAGATDVWYYIEAGSSFTNRAWPPGEGRTVTTFHSFDDAFVLVTDAGGTAQSVLVTQPSGSQKTGLTPIDDSDRSAAVVQIAPDEPVEVTWHDDAGRPIAAD